MLFHVTYQMATGDDDRIIETLCFTRKYLILRGLYLLALSANASVIRMLKMNIPERPTRCRVRLPARSISGIVMSVITTIVAPTPLVACVAAKSDRPALLKKLDE